MIFDDCRIKELCRCCVSQLIEHHIINFGLDESADEFGIILSIQEIADMALGVDIKNRRFAAAYDRLCRKAAAYVPRRIDEAGQLRGHCPPRLFGYNLESRAGQQECWNQQP